MSDWDSECGRQVQAGMRYWREQASADEVKELQSRSLGSFTDFMMADRMAAEVANAQRLRRMFVFVRGHPSPEMMEQIKKAKDGGMVMMPPVIDCLPLDRFASFYPINGQHVHRPGEGQKIGVVGWCGDIIRGCLI